MGPALADRATPGGIDVFIVTETRPYRDALVLALEADERFRLAGAAGDVGAAVATLEALARPPRVLLLDHAIDGARAGIRALLDAAPGVSVIAVAVDGSGRDVVTWAEAGAAGIVSRDASLDHLLANVAAVAQGETLCSPRQAAVLVDRVAALARARRVQAGGMAEQLHHAAAKAAGRRADGLGIRLLGNLAIQRGSVTLPAFPTQRSEALFAYLVIHRDRLVHRDVLCGQFWPDRPDAQARKALRTALWRIRSVLEADPSDRGTLVQVDGDQIGFAAPPRVWVDVWELEECVRLSEGSAGGLDDPAARRLGRAAQLYRGDFLEGHYDDWCAQPRERLRTDYLSALERLVVHHGEQGDLLAAIACARRVLRHDPLREHVHRALMSCHLAMGDRPSAVRQYQRCARVLGEELGIEPMDETRALYERIRRGTAPVRGPAPRRDAPHPG